LTCERNKKGENDHAKTTNRFSRFHPSIRPPVCCQSSSAIFCQAASGALLLS
jgi:hypothetical protein